MYGCVFIDVAIFGNAALL